MQWYIGVLKNYAGFSGRARRTEFWMYFLFNAIIFIVLGALSRATGFFSILYYLYALATLIPSLAVGSRRLHDTGKSGWLQLLGIIPVVGTIILIVFWATAGNPGPNQYGQDPKGGAGGQWQGGQLGQGEPPYPGQPYQQPYQQGQQGQPPYQG